MGVWTRAITFVSGTIIYASSVMRIENDLGSTINAINSANIITSGVDAVNINACAVTTVKIALSAVDNSALNNGAVDADKIDGEVKLYQEVFS